MALIDKLVREKVQAERMLAATVVGGATPDEIARCAWLSADAFSDFTSAEIWRQVISNGQVDLSKLDQGDLVDILNWTGKLPYPLDPEHYAGIVQRNATYLLLTNGLTDIIQAIGQSDYQAVPVLLDKVRQVDVVGMGGTTVKTSAQMDSEFQGMIAQGAPPSIKLGIADLDDYVAACEGELTVLAGRAGMGKTAVACQIAQNAADQGKKVLFMSLEMPSAQLWARMACAGTGFTWMQIKTGRLNQSELSIVSACSSQLVSRYGDLILVEDSVWRVQDILRIAAQVRPDLLIVDNLGEIEWHEEGVGETVWYGRAARTLRRDAARRLKCHVLLLHHINREPDKRSDSRPMLSDLRWSGDIERLTDTVIFMYREDQYGNDPSINKSVTMFPVELWVRKNRYGMSNVCSVGLFNAKTLRVERLP